MNTFAHLAWIPKAGAVKRPKGEHHASHPTPTPEEEANHSLAALWEHEEFRELWSHLPKKVLVIKKFEEEGESIEVRQKCPHSPPTVVFRRGSRPIQMKSLKAPQASRGPSLPGVADYLRWISWPYWVVERVQGATGQWKRPERK